VKAAGKGLLDESTRRIVCASPWLSITTAASSSPRGERVPRRGDALQGVTLLASRWRHDGGARRGLDRIVDQRPDHGWLDAPALVGDGNRIGFDHDLDDWRDPGFFRFVEPECDPCHTCPREIVLFSF
jgi:hypothetical protein